MPNDFVIDPSQNIFGVPKRDLDPIFSPRSIAIVGAKDDAHTVARTIVNNLKEGGFSGPLYPINPKRSEVLGLKCYPTLTSVGAPIDLIVIVTPNKTAPALIEECSKLGIPAAIIITAGFKEIGEEGEKLEREILEIAHRAKIRIVGPNCLGVMNPHMNMNATFAAGMALKGNIAFVSQSGALCTSVLDWSLQEKIGFSAFASIGTMMDIEWADLIDYFGQDPNTYAILMYMESIGNARRFLATARKVALAKPIIVIKSGRTSEAAEAAASHTGSMSGSDDVFDAAMQRAGILRVNSVFDLFGSALILAKQPIPKGPKLTILTNAGGPGVLATDAAIFSGAELAPISKETIEKMNEFLPMAWSHSNPVDILGDAGADKYEKAIEEIGKDSNADGVLVILTPQDMTDSLGIAKAIIRHSKLGKPIIASWMGGKSVQAGAELLSTNGIPNFLFPDEAARLFGMMWNYSEELRLLYNTPTAFDEVSDPKANLSRLKAVEEILDKADREDREILTEEESKRVLHAYGIPIVETLIAATKGEARKLADKLGYPIVLKIHSETITHKSDVGGVILNIKTGDEVEKAYDQILHSVTEKVGKEHFLGVTVQRMISLDGYQLILGSSVDPQFGPVLLFGTGGVLTEVFQDRALALPPLNNNLARSMMEKTKIYKALLGVRGKGSVDMKALEKLLINFSRLITEHPRIKELDVNPLLASEKELIALDARVLIFKKTAVTDLPKVAIRPYPIEYVETTQLSDGTHLVLRPIRPEDELLMVDFHKNLSEQDVWHRYLKAFSLSERTGHDRLIRVCFANYDYSIPMIAEVITPSGIKEIVAVGRLEKDLSGKKATLTILVIDAFQNRGLGTMLIEKLLTIAKIEKIERIEAALLKDNSRMIHICKKLHFEMKETSKNQLISIWVPSKH